MRRVAHYFRFNNDLTNFRKFAKKTGDYYSRAAKNLWDSGCRRKASILYIKAADCYREIGDHASAKSCSLAVRNYYATIFKNSLTNIQGSAQDWKSLGDYLREEGDIEEARECYEAAAKRALEDGKLILAGGLFRDAGDCSSLLNDIERTADNYAMAADQYFKSKKYFEAAWHYNLSGFLLISLKRFDEALLMAKKAKKACFVGNLLILSSLSKTCELLSRRNYLAAEEEWRKIRRKFKRNYAELVDSCFRRADEI